MGHAPLVMESESSHHHCSDLSTPPLSLYASVPLPSVAGGAAGLLADCFTVAVGSVAPQVDEIFVIEHNLELAKEILLNVLLQVGTLV